MDKWKSHFQAMTHGKIPVESVYVLNQKGKGLGTNPKGWALYKIQSGHQSISNPMNSPANKGYAMAVGQIKNTEKGLNLGVKDLLKELSTEKPKV